MQDINNSENTEVMSLLVRDLLNEKRADRRWKNIRFVLWFVFFVFIAFNIFRFTGKAPVAPMNNKYAALIRIDGMIAPGRDLSAEQLVPLMQDAFRDKNSQGVIIDINSPGGTPVQSAAIHDAIVSLKAKYHKKVIVVGEDLLTSGAYFVAVSADKIYVNPNTIVGSVGVVMKGFGFVEVMKKIGIDRRVYTAGANKDRLDPFLPENPDDVKKIQQVMDQVHTNFTQAVQEGRKGKLKADPATLFTGDFWSGQTALELGLVDGLGNLMDVAEKEFGTSQFKEFTNSNNIFRMLGGELGSTLDTYFYSVA